MARNGGEGIGGRKVRGEIDDEIGGVEGGGKEWFGRVYGVGMRE